MRAWACWRIDFFGLFIRRGAFALQGPVIMVQVYDHLFRRFHPVHFGAKEWVAITWAAGIR